MQKGTVWVHFWPRGRTPMVDTKKASEKSAGRWQRLHDLRSMRLLVPAVKSLEELNQGCDLGIVECTGREWVGLNIPSKGAQRFALGVIGGALPRTPASFRLSAPRFAGRWNNFGACCCLKVNWWASRWLSASRRWRCRPSQPRIGLANRFPGF